METNNTGSYKIRDYYDSSKNIDIFSGAENDGNVSSDCGNCTNCDNRCFPAKQISVEEKRG